MADILAYTIIVLAGLTIIDGGAFIGGSSRGGRGGRSNRSIRPRNGRGRDYNDY